MFRLALVLISLLIGGELYAQRVTLPNHYGSPSGFGSVLFPGTGRPPITVPGAITDPRFPSNLSKSIRGFPITNGRRGGFPGRRNTNTVVIPYPVFVGGVGYDYGYPPPAYAYPPVMQPAQQSVTPPIVIINQGYRPETANPEVRDYSNAESTSSSGSSGAMQTYTAPVHPFPDPTEQKDQPAPAAVPADDQRPTIYLIAFKDHTILPALAYWVEGDTLNYVTQNGVPNRVSLTLVDKQFSKQLNAERSIEFNLP
jgi:hypothetical protein